MTLVGSFDEQLQGTTQYTMRNSKRFYFDWDIYNLCLLVRPTIASSYIQYNMHELGSAVD